KWIDLEIHIAGRVFTESFPPEANLSLTFTWDGKDVYGRKLQGAQPAKLRIGYVYDAVYYASPVEFQIGFGRLSGVPISGSRARQEIALWQEYEAKVGPWEAKDHGLGGWTLDVHHFYDPGRKMLYLGDGSRRSARGVETMVIETVAGNGMSDEPIYYIFTEELNNPIPSWEDEGKPAKEVIIAPNDIAVGPDGSFYFIDHGIRICRVTPEGTIGSLYQIEGVDEMWPSEYNAPYIFSLAVGPKGEIYFVEYGDIRKRNPDGRIETIAEEEGATDLAVGPDGSIYYTLDWLHQVKKIDPDGTIITIAGQEGVAGYAGDGGPASAALLDSPYGIALGPDGSIYIADTENYRVRRIGPDGIITTVVGTGVRGAAGSGDGGPADQARLDRCKQIAVDQYGGLYLQDGSLIRYVGPDGIILTVAGAKEGEYDYYYYPENGCPARQTYIDPNGLAVGPDGALYISEWEHVIHRLTSVLPGFTGAPIAIPAEDGSLIYCFDANGRHLRTVDAFTGATIYTFRYDEKGLLVGIEDVDGNLTTIERDFLGNPTAI
ncbi:MAG: hypothetical protein K6U03_10565, partial [Firmicutes bacterium]|nr:hypothetical protein [Bacillota bacterium]